MAIKYKVPNNWDYHNKDGDLIQSVYFDSMFFCIGEKNYKILCTEVYSGIDTLHTIRNMETNEVREVLGTTIRKWLDSYHINNRTTK